MGLFDKKKSADFGSPVEQVDLGSHSSRTSHPGTSPAPAAVTPTTATSGGYATAYDSSASGRYGIREAIELMRALPGENVDLVVQVVKRTLESAQIRISGIIDDASGRQGEIESRISILRQEIAELDREIAVRKSEIHGLESDYQETSLVKDRLLLAERLSATSAPQPVPTSVTAPTAVGAAVPVQRTASGAEPIRASTDSVRHSGTFPAGAVPTRAQDAAAAAPVPRTPTPAKK